MNRISINEYEKLSEEEKHNKAQNDWNEFFNSCSAEQKENLLYLSKMTAYEQADMKSTIIELKVENERLENELDWERRNEICIVKQLDDPKSYVSLEDYKNLKQQLKEKDEEITNLVRKSKWFDEFVDRYNIDLDRTPEYSDNPLIEYMEQVNDFRWCDEKEIELLRAEMEKDNVRR